MENKANKPTVDQIVFTPSFKRAYKSLKKDHRNDVLKDIDDTIEKLAHYEITTQKSNHPLHGKNNKGICDLHIRKDIILLYRYQFDTLFVTLNLENIVNHKGL